MNTNPQVDLFFTSAKKWQEEMLQLRKILLDCGLTEELKWSKPCYIFQGTNIIVIQGFKDYCALLFFKGMLMSNANGILVKTGENTRVGRQIRFTNTEDIIEMEAVIKANIFEAIEIEKTGLKVEAAQPEEMRLPEEFERKLTDIPNLKAAFNALTPGRQRAYNIYFSAPKQSKTRTARVEKYIQQILSGKGLND
ncbi:YdeI/OmpD-associated family protein [Pedobacter agri]|uniref:YdeI/OmpD-associated family protein n=1 Tax=Pedobacter agri TaxID=454586 RepID=UPI002930EF06|nr:DUF1801 domain-containing protein [Pedobacter agri]